MITVSRGTNADLIANVAQLYLPDGALVADVTYGKGVFWRKCQERRATILASDVKPIVLSQEQQDWSPAACVSGVGCGFSLPALCE